MSPKVVKYACAIMAVLVTVHCGYSIYTSYVATNVAEDHINQKKTYESDGEGSAWSKPL